jgi:hypothetical protein
MSSEKNKDVLYTPVEEGRFGGLPPSKSSSNENSRGNMCHFNLPALVQLENLGLNQSFPVYQMAWNSISYSFEFKDENLRELYFSFRVVNTSPMFVLIMAIFLVVVGVASWIILATTQTDLFTKITTPIQAFFYVFLLVILVYFRLAFSLADQQTKYRAIITTLEVSITIGFIIVLGVVMVIKGLPDCSQYGNTNSCTDKFNASQISTSFAMLLFPLIFSMIFPFLPNLATVLAEGIAIGFVLFVLFYTKASGQAGFIALMIILILFVLVVNKLQHMELFLYITKCSQILEEKAVQEKNIAKKLSDEMRNLSGSISHDMKSVIPLSFLFWLCFIQSLIYFSSLASFSVYSWI